MSLRSPSGPKELRTALHTFYEPYAQGIAEFPRVRINPEAVDTLPAKTQPIARALVDAWRDIDHSQEIHEALVRNILDDPESALTLDDGSPGKGMVVSRIGRNSLVEVIFTLVHAEPTVLIQETTVGPRKAVEDYLANANIELADGRIITGGGFDDSLVPDIEIPVPTGPETVSRVVHFDARLGQAA